MISLSFLNFTGGFDIFKSDSKDQAFSSENVCKLVCLGAFPISRSPYSGQCIPEIFQVVQAKKIPKAKRRKCSSPEFPTIPNVIPPWVRSKHSAPGKSFLPNNLLFRLVPARSNPVFQSPADRSGQTEQHNDWRDFLQPFLASVGLIAGQFHGFWLSSKQLEKQVVGNGRDWRRRGCT